MTPKNVPVFNYHVGRDPHSATKPKCPGNLHRAGNPLKPGSLSRVGMSTARLNIHFTLQHDYAAHELVLVYGRCGSDLDHVHIDGKWLGAVRGVGEGKWRRWRRPLPRLAKGKHVLTFTTHGGIGNAHILDFFRLVGPKKDAPGSTPEVDPEVEPEVEPEVDPGPDLEPQPEGTLEPEAVVEISAINYDGAERMTEGDEYVEITNSGDAPADISGWRLYADDRGQDFVFPDGTTLAAGQSIRVYTNRDDPATGGFSYGSGRAIWNNKGDLAALFDAEGEAVATLGYGSKAPPAPETEATA